VSSVQSDGSLRPYSQFSRPEPLLFPPSSSSVVWWSKFLATDPVVRVRFPALPDFLRSSGPGTGSTQPREYN
jgi:hypothetical protein